MLERENARGVVFLSIHNNGNRANCAMFDCFVEVM